VGSRARLEAVTKRKNHYPCRVSNLGIPARSLISKLRQLKSTGPSDQWKKRVPVSL